MKTLIGLVILAGVAYAEDHKCVVEKPVPVPVSNAKPAACHKPSAKLEKAITAELVKSFIPERMGKAEVKFPCDGLGSKVYEISLETGSGHAGSLNLWRARRRSDGKFTVRGVGFQGLHPRKPGVIDISAGVVELPELDRVRAAITATVREVVPQAKPGETLGMQGSFSSRDLHIVLRLVDDDGRVVERRFTGYTSSDKQSSYLGMLIAELALAPIWKLTPDPALSINDDDRTFFAASFNAAVPYFDDQFYWWVMERYVRLAQSLGTNEVIGGLLTRLVVTPGGNRSRIDARTNALEALAQITGWDARKDKSVELAAKAYLDTCK